MASSVRHPSHPVVSAADQTLLGGLSTLDDFWRSLSNAPYSFDLFFALRWIDAKSGDTPRLGRGARPSDEKVRIGQHVSLNFAPSPIHAVEPATAHSPPTIRQNIFGLFGSNGPLPTHITELVHERVATAGDRTLTKFADIFHHRANTLFYRAWADAQSTVSLDRRSGDQFSRYISSLIGYGTPGLLRRDKAPDHAKRFAAGHLVRQTRNPEGLEFLIAHYFGVACQVAEFRFDWLHIAPSEQTRLGLQDQRAQLGVGTVVGSRVPDRQHRFDLVLGPMSAKAYNNFLPTGSEFKTLTDWVRNYINYEYAWKIQLTLAANEVPSTTLGGSAQLGWTTWLRSSAETQDRSDLILNPEKILRGPGYSPP